MGAQGRQCLSRNQRSDATEVRSMSAWGLRRYLRRSLLPVISKQAYLLARTCYRSVPRRESLSWRCDSLPASSIASLDTWGVYLIASAALIAALMPPLVGTVQYSREGSDYRIADGIRSVLDSLRPGTVTSFYFGSWSTGDSAHLDGHEVILTYGNGTVALQTRYNLPNVTLSPDVHYQVWLKGNQVDVSGAG